MCIASVVAAALLLAPFCAAQGLLQSQNFTFNSSFVLSQDQIKKANLTAAEINNFQTILNHERSNWAGGSVRDDAFYKVPDSFDPSNSPPPGTIIKLETRTDTSKYTIPPTVAMSRFLYTTETLNGTSIPASAYVLWPYVPRRFVNIKSSGHQCDEIVYPLVALAHGTSGQRPECAPSRLRGLWDEFHEPFPLVLNGYAVVAPDYAGLGVADQISPYFVLPAQANNLAHAITSAQKAFPNLSREFAAMGQSQGGGVAWSFAQRQVQRPLPGYLGTVAVSPFTDILANIALNQQAANNNNRVVGIAQGLGSVLPSFRMSDWITQAGLDRYELLRETGGCGAAGGVLFSTTTTPVLKDGWNETDAADWYRRVSDNGGKKPFASPMLVLQGDEDAIANVHVNGKAVGETCDGSPNGTLHYIQYNGGVTHVPTLYASMHTWLDWIRDRLDGVRLPRGCVTEDLQPATWVANGAGQNWAVLFDQYGISYDGRIELTALCVLLGGVLLLYWNAYGVNNIYTSGYCRTSTSSGGPT